MIKSMTGFGRAEVLDKSHKFTIELKTVNHRYLDLGVRLPRQLSFFETAVRNYLKKHILRGKVDVFIFFEDYSPQKVLLTYNEGLAQQYLDHFRQIEKEFQIKNDITLSTLARLPEVFAMEQQVQDEDSLWRLLEEGLKKAVANLIDARELEGETSTAVFNTGTSPVCLELPWDAPFANDVLTGGKFPSVDGKLFVAVPPEHGMLLI